MNHVQRPLSETSAVLLSPKWLCCLRT